MEQKFITLSFTVEQAKRITNGEIDGRIVTRNGSSVRIICWDCKGEYNIVALVSNNKKGTETARYYDADGCEFKYTAGAYDLLLQFPEYATFKDGDVLKGDKLIFVLNANGDYKTSIYAGIFLPSGNITYGGAASMDHIENFTLATEAEKQILIEALQSSEDKRAEECLKKLGIEVKPECELKPFDKVLVRDSHLHSWDIDFFKEYTYSKDLEGYVYKCFVDDWNYCIPYEGNEHLLGTTNSADE